ncbi:MAG: hypothetical protein HY695_30665 [Deltaproteobacteria bacterium]|nr:hypothetical protein [Deltaproteobacteria bacterium]
MADLTFTIEIDSNGVPVLKNIRHAAEESGKKLEGAFARASGGIDAFVAKARGIAGVLGVTFGAASIVQFSRTVLNAADRLGDLAENTGLSMKTLIGMRQIVAQTGVSIESLARGVQMAQRNLGDLASGESQEAANAVKQLGLSMVDLQRSSPDEFLKKVSTALAGVEDRSIRASLGAKLLGRGGLDLQSTILMLAQQGLPKVSEEMEKAYKTLSEFTDALALAKARAVDFWAAVAGRGVRALGFGKTLKEELEADLANARQSVTILESFAQRGSSVSTVLDQARARVKGIEITLAKVEAGEAAREKKPGDVVDPTKIKAASDAAFELTQSLTQQIETLRIHAAMLSDDEEKLRLLAATVDSLAGKLKKQGIDTGPLKNAFANKETELRDALKKASIAEAAKAALKQGQGPSIADLFDQERLEETLLAAADPLKQAQREAQDAAHLMELSVQSWTSVFDRMDTEFGEFLIKAQENTAGIGQVFDSLASRLAMIDEEARLFGGGIDAAGARLQALKDAVLKARELGAGVNDPRVQARLGQAQLLEEQQRLVKGIEDIVREAGSGINETFRGIMLGTQSVGDAFKNLAQNVLISVAKMATQILILDPLLKQLKASLEEIAGSSAGGSGGGGGFGWQNILGAVGGAVGGFDFGSLFVPGAAFGPSLNLTGGWYHEGGLVGPRGIRIPSFQSGGEVPIMATPGEFVIRKLAVRSIGAATLSAINQTGQVPSGSDEPIVLRVTNIIQGSVTPNNPRMRREEVVQTVCENIRTNGRIKKVILEKAR